MTPKHGKFTRRTRSKPSLDEKCLVRVLVEPYEIVDNRWTYKRGNISRTVSVEAAKVSEVFDIVERALFGASRAT